VKASKTAGATARDVVRRIEDVMAQAAQHPKSATPTHATAPAHATAKPAAAKHRKPPLLAWGADLAPGNVTLDWGEIRPKPDPVGVRLAWQSETASAEKK
jgi:hypothetical protein